MAKKRSALDRPTIKQIAQEAGVSISTASNALNGNTDEMSEDTLLRVQGVVQRLNYRPNQIARGLVTRRTATIGLILTEIETPLFLQALSAVERDARASGYSLLLIHARNTDEEHEAVELLLEKRIDGIMFLSTSDLNDDDHIQAINQLGLPVVLVNRSTPHENLDQVNWDNQNGMTQAVDHLAGLGHHRIAHLVGPEHRAGTEERLRGYRLGLARHNLPFRDIYIQNGNYAGPSDQWRGSTHLLMSLPQPPTAIIAADDTVAAVVLETLRQSGIRVPQDMSVVGIDDQPFLSFLGLTTVRLPVSEAAKLAINLLIERIARPDIDVRHTLLPCPLIVRGTTGQAPMTLMEDLGR